MCMIEHGQLTPMLITKLQCNACEGMVRGAERVLSLEGKSEWQNEEEAVMRVTYAVT